MRRRIFVAGLDTRKSNCRVPKDEDDYMFSFTPKEGSIKDVHILYPNNLVIADFEWLKANWDIVENWYHNENGSHFQDCWVMESEGKNGV